MASLQERPPPSAAAIAIGAGIIGLITGYFLGQAQSIGIFSSAKEAVKTNAKHSAGEDSSSSDLEDSDEELLPTPGEFSDFSSSNEECKLVLVVRTDLGMTKGSLASAVLILRMM